MNGRRWLGAWWDQIVGKPAADPWNDDPEIVQERERQHRLGIVDSITVQRAHDSDFWQRRHGRNQEDRQ